MRALIVDDNPSDALLMAETIRGLVDVEFATSGKEAQQRLAKNKYDVVVLDYFLGDMTGAELMVHAFTPEADPPVVFCSGIEDDKIVSQAMGLGARDFVLKGHPDFVTELRTAVHDLLQAQQQRTAPPSSPTALHTQLAHILDEALQRHPECNVAAVVGEDDFQIRSRIQIGDDIAGMVVRIVHEVHETLGHSTRHLGYRDGRCTISSYNQGLFGISPLLGGGSVVLASHTPETPLEEFRVALERLAAEVGHAIGDASALRGGIPPVPPTEAPAVPRT